MRGHDVLVTVPPAQSGVHAQMVRANILAFFKPRMMVDAALRSVVVPGKHHLRGVRMRLEATRIARHGGGKVEETDTNII